MQIVGVVKVPTERVREKPPDGGFARAGHACDQDDHHPARRPAATRAAGRLMRGG
jgi:hypothetical protein